MRPNGFYGAPDLVVEVLSRSTGKYDRGNKKDIYQRSGVREYWTIDPNTSEVRGYELVNGTFDAFPSSEGIIRSALLGGEFRF